MIRWVPVLVVVAAMLVPAQEPAFDVASVKVTDLRGGGGRSLPPGEVRFGGSPLRLIVPEAFGFPVQLWELKIIPSREVERLWRTPRFEIQAKGNPEQDTRAMLRTLLKERFGMRYHTETRQLPIYVLTVKTPGTLGPGLTPTPFNCREFRARGGKRGDPDSPKRGDVEACWPSANGPRSGELGAGTIDDLIETVAIPGTLGERPVIDATGLKGNFLWDVTFVTQEPPDDVFRAFEERLGLKLEQRTGPWEVVVIDDISMPTPN